MALNLSDRIAVRRVIVDRCTAAVANYALYILGNGASTTQQLAWAREAIRTPQQVGDQVSWYLMSEPFFIDGGSSIADDKLTGAVEAAINAHFIQAA